MFEGWDEFYLLAGSAAAVLIGLIFVVISLMGDRPRSNVLAGSRLYMGPIVLSLSFVLVVSSLALVPGVTAHGFALITGVIAAWGLVRAILSTIGIRRLGSEVHWTDLWFYGFAPTVIYVALGAIAATVWTGWEWCREGLGAVTVAILLLAVRNEWDLITWIVPRSEDDVDFSAAEQEKD